MYFDKSQKEFKLGNSSLRNSSFGNSSLENIEFLRQNSEFLRLKYPRTPKKNLRILKFPKRIPYRDPPRGLGDDREFRIPRIKI